jgi:segregation and condensation protein B
MRRREFMMRVEAVIFAACQPVTRETLAAVTGSDCNLDLLIEDIRDELRSRPYELVDVAGGVQHRTRRVSMAMSFVRLEPWRSRVLI